MKVFRRKADAKKFLEELLKKKWFEKKGGTVRKIVLEKLEKDDTKEIKRSAEYWNKTEQIKRNFNESVD